MKKINQSVIRDSMHRCTIADTATSKTQKSNTILHYLFSMLMNSGIEEDREYPKEPSHMDYKYLKTEAGPLVQ